MGTLKPRKERAESVVSKPTKDEVRAQGALANYKKIAQRRAKLQTSTTPDENTSPAPKPAAAAAQHGTALAPKRPKEDRVLGRGTSPAVRQRVVGATYTSRIGACRHVPSRDLWASRQMGTAS